METFKPIVVFVAVCVFFAFNLRLHTDNQGVLYSQHAMADGWHLKCRYYTAFYFYELEAPVQTGCGTYAPVVSKP